MTADLVLTDLACRRGGRLLFSGLSATVPAGHAAALRGPNGAGKSTLLRALAGFLAPDRGDARLGPLSRTADAAAFQEQVAYAGHLDAIKPALGVRQNLSFWAGIFGAGPERVAAAMERFGLGPIAEQAAAHCSAGQKRRLGLARLALVDRPLWLLDEPTVSLDAENTALVAALVAEHCGRGGIAVIATHIDLGLGQMAELRLEPPAREEMVAETADTDGFLDGDWT